MSDKGVTEQLPGSDWHIIRSIGVENRGDEVPINQVGAVREFIPGIREMVLTIVGEFPEDDLDIVEVNGKRFRPEA
jgi:hypothetical protein